MVGIMKRPQTARMIPANSEVSHLLLHTFFHGDSTSIYWLLVATLLSSDRVECTDSWRRQL